MASSSWSATASQKSFKRKFFNCAETFFALPTDEKMEVSIKKSLGLSNRGDEAIHGQTLQSGMLPDLKEVSHTSLFAKRRPF